MEHREWIAGQIATLLSFYWQPDESLAVAAEAGRMWADALERFDQWEIEAACRRWLHSESRRPTPAEIIKLCLDERPKPRRVEQIEHYRTPPTPEEIARIDALLSKTFPGIVRRIERSGEE